MSLLGNSVNRGNGQLYPGIYKRRGKDSNLRGLNPIAHPPARPPPKLAKTFGNERGSYPTTSAMPEAVTLKTP